MNRFTYYAQYHQKKNRVIEKIKEALLAAAFLLFFLEWVFLILWLKVNGLEMIWFPVSLLVVWIAVYRLLRYVSQKRQKKAEAEYRRAYISEKTLTDDRLGTIVFEWDSLNEEMKSVSCALPPFGNARPDTVYVIIQDDTSPEEALELIREALHAAYDRMPEILDKCREYVKETYDDEDIRDAQGEPITREEIERALSLTVFTVSIHRNACPGVAVTVEGDMLHDYGEHIAEHGVSVELMRDTDGGEWHFLGR